MSVPARRRQVAYGRESGLSARRACGGAIGVELSFNGKFRDECLSLEWFRSRAEAKVTSTISRRMSSRREEQDQRPVRQRAGTLRYLGPPRPAPLLNRPIAFLVYAITVFVGWRESWADLRDGLARRWLPSRNPAAAMQAQLLPCPFWEPPILTARSAWGSANKRYQTGHDRCGHLKRAPSHRGPSGFALCARVDSGTEHWNASSRDPKQKP